MADLSDLAVQSNNVAQQTNPEFAALNTIIQSRTIPFDGLGDFVYRALNDKRGRDHDIDKIKLQNNLAGQRTLDTELRRLNDELMRNGFQPSRTAWDARQRLGRLYEQNNPNIGQNMLPYAVSPNGSGYPLAGFSNSLSNPINTGAGMANPYATGTGSFSDVLSYDDKNVLYGALTDAWREAVNTGDYTKYNQVRDTINKQSIEARKQRPSNLQNNTIGEKLYNGVGSSFVDFVNASNPDRINRTTAIQDAYPFIKPDLKTANESWTARGRQASIQRSVEDQLQNHQQYLADNGLSSVMGNNVILNDLVSRGLSEIISQIQPGYSLSDVDVATKDNLTFHILIPSLQRNIIVRKVGNSLAVIGED